MKCLQRRRRRKMLLRCRKFMAEVYKCKFDDDAIFQVIASIPNVRGMEYERGGFRPAIVRGFFNGERIFASEFHGREALHKAAFQIYILWYEKIKHP